MQIYFTYLLLCLPILGFSQDPLFSTGLSDEPLELDTLYSMGLPDEPDAFYETIELKALLTRSSYDAVPTRASLKKYAPIPKSQGQYGTCAAWATSYAARTILEAQKNDWTDKHTITQNAFSPGYIYRLAAPNRWNCWGAYTSVCIDKMKQVGDVKARQFTDPCPQAGISNTWQRKGERYKIPGYARLWGSSSRDRDAKITRTKKSLSEGNPVVISMLCPRSFHRVRGNGLWRPTETALDSKHGRHAMCVVGYDDYKFGGAFEIQNSWGTGYGNGGYVWVRYNDFARFVYQAFELFQFQKPKPKPNPRPRPNPKPKPQPIGLSGALKLIHADGSEMKARLADKGRNFNLTPVGKYTYRLVKPTPSGTQFRIYLDNNEPAYVYLLGTGSVNKSVATLFPTSGYSPALNYKSNQVAIPNEDYFIESDNTIGKDYLILLYSKEALNIETIRQKMEQGAGDFTKKLKVALGSRLIAHKSIKFEEHHIQFKASTTESKQTVVPIVVMFDHVE